MIDELGQLERLLGLELHRLDLVIVDQDVIALLDLIAFDDLLGRHRADARHHLSHI
jgi:hypothetical protein